MVNVMGMHTRRRPRVASGEGSVRANLIPSSHACSYACVQNVNRPKQSLTQWLRNVDKSFRSQVAHIHRCTQSPRKTGLFRSDA